jgi:hypothetical protein
MKLANSSAMTTAGSACRANTLLLAHSSGSILVYKNGHSQHHLPLPLIIARSPSSKMVARQKITGAGAIKTINFDEPGKRATSSPLERVYISKHRYQRHLVTNPGDRTLQ